MSYERDELAKIAFVVGSVSSELDAAANWDVLLTRTIQPKDRALGAQYRIADAILAAGYRKPRTVSTAEELDTLPVGAVVILRDSHGDPHPAQKGSHGWRLPFVEGFWKSENLLVGTTSAEVVP